MINFLRIASILDNLGCFKLSDRFTKLAIDQSDLDFDKVYSNPETYSDRVINRSRKENVDPLQIMSEEKPISDPSKDPMDQLEEASRGMREYSELYPTIVLFPENGVWKFFYTDPLSFKTLSKGSDKDGKLITDQLSVPGLTEMYSDEEDAEKLNHEVVYTTDLTLEDNSTEEAIRKVRNRFPDATIDYMFNGVDDREFFDEEKDIELSSS
jgi:hypothetical protein